MSTGPRVSPTPYKVALYSKPLVVEILKIVVVCTRKNCVYDEICLITVPAQSHVHLKSIRNNCFFFFIFCLDKFVFSAWATWSDWLIVESCLQTSFTPTSNHRRTSAWKNGYTTGQKENEFMGSTLMTWIFTATWVWLKIISKGLCDLATSLCPPLLLALRVTTAQFQLRA